MVSDDGTPIQSKTRSQRLVTPSISDPETVIRLSKPTTCSMRTVLPDFDGPEIDMTSFGVAKACLSCCSRGGLTARFT